MNDDDMKPFPWTFVKTQPKRETVAERIRRLGEIHGDRSDAELDSLACGNRGACAERDTVRRHTKVSQ